MSDGRAQLYGGITLALILASICALVGFTEWLHHEERVEMIRRGSCDAGAP